MRQLLPRNFAEAKGLSDLSESDFLSTFIRKEFNNVLLEVDKVTRIWILSRIRVSQKSLKSKKIPLELLPEAKRS